MSEELKKCPIKMVQIYEGKDPDWIGWYNAILTDSEIPVALCPPIVADALFDMIRVWQERTEPKPPSADVQEALISLEVLTKGLRAKANLIDARNPSGALSEISNNMRTTAMQYEAHIKTIKAALERMGEE